MAVTFQGTKIGISVDGVTYTQIGCIVGYDMAGGGKTEIDVSCSESTSKEYIFGLKDNGTLSIDVNYDPESPGWALAEASEDSNNLYFFEIEFSNKPDENTGAKGTIKTFKGSVTNTSDSGAIDDKLSGTIEIKISGDITQTPPVAGTP